MVEFIAYPNPILAVMCPTCGKSAGVMCQRPSGHRASEFHFNRCLEADRVFIEQHGVDASIVRIGATWVIDPCGRLRD